MTVSRFEKKQSSHVAIPEMIGGFYWNADLIDVFYCLFGKKFAPIV